MFVACLPSFRLFLFSLLAFFRSLSLYLYLSWKKGLLGGKLGCKECREKALGAVLHVQTAHD